MTASSVVIRPLREDDLDAADRIFRLAFGTQLGLPHPASFAGDADWVRTRWRAEPAAALAADLDGRLVGSNFVARWGSVGFLGPLTVHPDLWNAGIGARLLEATMPLFDTAGVRQTGLFTFSDSPKHVALYQRFGFWPHFLTAILQGAADGPPVSPVRWSAHGSHERERLLAGARALTDAIHPGLDLTREIHAVEHQALGDVVVTPAADGLDGLAICHCGPGSEAGSDVCYVKFAAVRPGPHAPERFGRLLDACAATARACGVRRLVAGVNTARRSAYRELLARGMRIEILGVSMQRGGDPAYDHADSFVIDDWR
jgi:N-acetylglutamate synthase-like GNAT family acetyltransferase